VTKLFWLGVAAIFALAAGSLILVWRVSEPGPPVASIAPADPGTATSAPAPMPPQQVVSPVATPEPERPAVEMATDRDPRNDIQRPDDRRADLLQDERSAKMQNAMDLLNRRTALRKEEMQANGEIRPSVPVKKAPRR